MIFSHNIAFSNLLHDCGSEISLEGDATSFIGSIKTVIISKETISTTIRILLTDSLPQL
jgi:hypothetical protein